VDAYAFPRPDDVARCRLDSLRRRGFSRQKARALLELARAIVEEHLDLEGLAALDDEAAVVRLLQIKGVGRWTAEYVLLRGLGRLHIFPGDDVGARKALGHLLGRRKPLDYPGVRRALAPWKPYAGLVYFHMLLDGLARAGYLL